MSDPAIDEAARILSRGCWDGCEVEGDIRCCSDPPCPCRTTAREIRDALARGKDASTSNPL